MQESLSSPAGLPDNGEPVGVNATVHEPISADGVPELGRRYEVPARQGRAVRLARGQVIRIINTHGSQVCDTWAFKADDLSEFMSMEHARAYIDRIIPKPGDPLATNRRRPIMTLLQDTSPGVHDTLMAACDAYRYRNLGVQHYHDNCADNMRLALKAIGLRSREVPQPLNLWMNIPVGADHGVQWLAPVSKAGDYVTLRAEMDCVVVMSACPQDIIPINDNRPVEVHFVVEAGA
ncbi:urea carboxylase-associated family protein [Orrella sp. JC864]|uniref:DUF1989 domain-containing protein n=1 Tax=Orrella sp. JC864 TaxID=3120298 RepID=UPI0012BD0D9D